MSLPLPGPVLSQVGAQIKNAYDGTVTESTIGTVMRVGRARRVRFFVRIVTDPASALTSVTMKLKQRYVPSDGVLSPFGWVDLPSHLDDAQGAAQPKGPTFEVEHVFTVAANQTKDFTFYLDAPQATQDLVLEAKANAAGAGTDSVKVYAEAA